jgi:hypothetical protein
LAPHIVPLFIAICFLTPHSLTASLRSSLQCMLSLRLCTHSITLLQTPLHYNLCSHSQHFSPAASSLPLSSVITSIHQPRHLLHSTLSFQHTSPPYSILAVNAFLQTTLCTPTSTYTVASSPSAKIRLPAFTASILNHQYIEHIKFSFFLSFLLAAYSVQFHQKLQLHHPICLQHVTCGDCYPTHSLCWQHHLLNTVSI